MRYDPLITTHAGYTGIANRDDMHDDEIFDAHVAAYTWTDAAA